jgi:hypothetical protein
MSDGTTTNTPTDIVLGTCASCGRGPEIFLHNWKSEPAPTPPFCELCWRAAWTVAFDGGRETECTTSTRPLDVLRGMIALRASEDDK